MQLLIDRRYIYTLLGHFWNFNFGERALLTIFANTSLVGKNYKIKIAPTDKHDQLLEFSKLKLEEISKTWKDCDQEDLELYYNKICGLVRKLEISIDETGERMLESERTLDEIKNWSVQQKEGLQSFENFEDKLN